MTDRAIPWPHWSEPLLRWQVQCYDSHHRPIGTPVFVGARNQQRAIATGKYWMRVLGRKVRGSVVAKRYHPERDPEFQRGDWRVVPSAKPTGSAS